MAGFLFGSESWVRGAGTGVAVRLPKRLQGVSCSAAPPRLTLGGRGAQRESGGI